MASLQDRQVTAAGQTFTIRFGLKAILALQEKWGLDDEKQVQERIEAAALGDFPAILWAAMRTHHPEMSEDAVLGWLDDAGMEGMGDMAGQLQKAMESAAPPPRPKRGQGKTTPTP
jgi:hypothetical protein